jgi:hypothetical protein
MLADSEEINSQSPEPQSESGDELIYPPCGLCNQEVFNSIWFAGGQRDKSVTQKQAGYRISPQPPTDCGHSHRKPCRA